MQATDILMGRRGLIAVAALAGASPLIEKTIPVAHAAETTASPATAILAAYAQT